MAYGTHLRWPTLDDIVEKLLRGDLKALSDALAGSADDRLFSAHVQAQGESGHRVGVRRGPCASRRAAGRKQRQVAAKPLIGKALLKNDSYALTAKGVMLAEGWQEAGKKHATWRAHSAC